MIFCGFVKASNPGVNPQKLPPNIHKSAAFYLKPKSAETQAMNFKSAGFITLVMRKIKITVKILRFPSEMRHKCHTQNLKRSVLQAGDGLKRMH